MKIFKTTISHTRKFFKRKFESFKIFITGGYQRLPKTSPFKPFSCGCKLPNTDDGTEKVKEPEREDQGMETSLPCSRSTRERRACLVGEKLIRELEMVDQRSSDEDRLDVEEVLHYYSRLTCPAYRDMVEQFLVNLYADIADRQNCSSG